MMSDASTASITREPVSRVVNVSSEAEFARLLEDAAGRLIVIDFYAQWCGPCKRIAPELDRAAVNYPEVVFLKVDIDELEEIAVEYEVTAMPTFIFLKKRKKLDRFTGANMDKVLENVPLKTLSSFICGVPERFLLDSSQTTSVMKFTLPTEAPVSVDEKLNHTTKYYRSSLLCCVLSYLISFVAI